MYAPNSTVPKSTALIELEAAYKVVDMELAVANKCTLDSQKESSSLKRELDLLKQELNNTKFRLEKVEKERAAARLEVEQHVEEIVLPAVTLALDGIIT